MVPNSGMLVAAVAGVLPLAATAAAPLPLMSPLRPKYCPGSPSRPPFLVPQTSLPNDIENPYRHQSTVTIPIEMTLIMIMFSTFFARTMPP